MASTPPAPVPILSLERLSKSFGDVRALDTISLDIVDGEFFTVVGPSGSGKSTLVRILAGLESPDSGRLKLRGEDITELPANRRPTCLVFQSLALFRHRSVGENVEFALKMRGVAPAERRDRALDVMNTVRLPSDYYSRRISQCSGGEQQRVALARALASDPDILFFDEPLSAMDFRLRKILEVEMKELQRRTGKTFIYITHSLEEAMVMSDRLGIMRDGRLVQTGTPQDIYAAPDSRFVAQFMGEVNTFSIGDGRIRELDVNHAPSGEGFLILRPEFLRPADADSAVSITFPATVTASYMLGSRTQYHLDADGLRLIAELPASAATLDVGSREMWGFDPSDAALTAD